MDDKEKLCRDAFTNLFDAPQDYFADDAKFYIWGPGHPPAVGPEGMKAGMAAVIAPLSDITFEWISFASQGNKVFSERTDSFTIDGHRVTVGVAGVGEIGADGKFVSWIDYFDLRPFAMFNLAPDDVGGVKQL